MLSLNWTTQAFFAFGWDDLSSICWPCITNNQIITGRKTLCLKFTFGAAIELQRASYLSVSYNGVLKRGDGGSSQLQLPWLFNSWLITTFSCQVYFVNELYTLSYEDIHIFQTENGLAVWDFCHCNLMVHRHVFTFQQTVCKLTLFYVRSIAVLLLAWSSSG